MIVYQCSYRCGVQGFFVVKEGKADYSEDLRDLGASGNQNSACGVQCSACGYKIIDQKYTLSHGNIFLVYFDFGLCVFQIVFF